jgi:hypothetical protein
MHNCVKLELTARSDMMNEDHEVIRKLGLSFKGKHAWPEFRSLLPGYAPWFLTESEAHFLTLGLNAACYHVERVNSGEVNESMRDGECLVYTPVDGAKTEFHAQWGPWPVHEPPPAAPPILNLARLNDLRSKRLTPDTPWEADVFYLPSPIFDCERPYYTRLVVVCQESTGFTFHADVSQPETPVPQLLADAICSSIEKHGFIPDTIFVKGADEAAVLMPLAKALGLAIRAQKNLDSIQVLKESMLDNLMRGGPPRRKRK